MTLTTRRFTLADDLQVDPIAAKVTVLVLEMGWYNEAEFRGDDPVESPTFPKLSLTVAKILKGDL
jgi:Uma2 family endonuclease